MENTCFMKMFTWTGDENFLASCFAFLLWQLKNLTYWGGHQKYPHIELALAEEVTRLVPAVRVQFTEKEVRSLDKKLQKGLRNKAN